MPKTSVTPCATSVSTNASEGVIRVGPRVTRRSTLVLAGAADFAEEDFLFGRVVMARLFVCSWDTQECASWQPSRNANVIKNESSRFIFID